MAQPDPCFPHSRLRPTSGGLCKWTPTRTSKPCPPLPHSSHPGPVLGRAGATHWGKRPAPAVQVAIWARRPGSWSDCMVWKGGFGSTLACLPGPTDSLPHGERGYSEEGQSGPLQPGLRVLMGRAAQPLTLFSTNK